MLPPPTGHTDVRTSLDNRGTMRPDVRRLAVETPSRPVSGRMPKRSTRRCRTGGTPLYRQIQSDLRERIQRRALPGTRLETEQELMARYEVSRATVRQALAGLVRDGLVEIRRGLGTFVRTAALEHRLGGFYSYSREIERHGLRPGTRVRDLGVEPAGPSVADSLGIEPGTRWWRSAASAWPTTNPSCPRPATCRRPASRGLERFDFSGRSLYDTLTSDFGVRPVRARETFEPVLLSEDEAEVLGGRRRPRPPGRAHHLRRDGRDHRVLPDASSVRTATTTRSSSGTSRAAGRGPDDHATTGGCRRRAHRHRSAAARLVARTTAWQEASTGGEAIAAALAVARQAPQELLDRLDGAQRIVITGAGSSLYIAQVAAAAMRTHCRLPAEAAPLSEVLLRPNAVFGPDQLADQPLVVVSRSGSTTEAVEVVKAARARGQHVIVVTCRPASPMAQLADATLAVPEGDEQAIVMTRSFAAQVTLLMRLGARLGESGLRGRPRRPARPLGWAGAVRRTGLRAGSGEPVPRRRPRRRRGLRHRQRGGPQADRDQPGPGVGLPPARVPPRTDLGLRAGHARRGHPRRGGRGRRTAGR